MVNEEIVGTDVDMNWTLGATKNNVEGDLATVSGSDNIAQAIFLRLSAYFDSLWWCYDSYGSYTKDWLGKIQNPYTRSTLLQEIAEKVQLDPRIQSSSVELVDWNATYIGVKIDVVVENKDYSEYFIFSLQPRKNEDVHHADYKDTWIDSLKEYYVIPGEKCKVHCHVFDMDNNRVPIGEVSIKIGNHLLTEPKEIEQSGEKEPGSVTFEFKLPRYFEYGDHELVFYYKGINGYNSSTLKVLLHIVAKIPTSTHFIYPSEDQYYYYANDVDDFTDSKVYIQDYNKELVSHGRVRYYLDEGRVVDGYMFIDSPIIFLEGVMRTDLTVFIRCREAINEYSIRYIFELSRMFHTADIIELTDDNGKIIDCLEVVYEGGIYFLTSTDLVFDEVDKDVKEYFEPNGDIKLKVIE